MRKTHSLIVVGSGITALVSALKAVAQGMDVTIISKSPCTRTCGPGQLFQSSTHDGSYNRYITSTEGHPYLDLDGYITKMYPDIARDFETTIAEGGMLALKQEEYSAETQAFLEQRKAINHLIKTDHQAWLHYEKLFNEYVAENIYSMKLWYEQLTDFLLEEPEFARELSVSIGIHRFYDEKDLFEGAKLALEKQGIIKDAFTIEEAMANPEFAAYHPGMERGSFIKGGALIMHGLAFNIKAVIRFLLEKLDKSGVRFLLGAQHEVVSIEYGENDAVEGIITRDGRLHIADHILFHPGAYIKPGLFRTEQFSQHMCGMKGFWAHIKGKTAERLIKGMGASPKACKIHGGKVPIEMDGQQYLSQVADLNVQPVVLTKENGGKEYILCIGSGYLFVGTYPFEGDNDVPKETQREAQRVQDIKRSEKLAIAGFWAVVRQVYDIDCDLDDCIAEQHPDITILQKGCIRSWSIDDRELRIVQKMAGGGVLIAHGGGNTGSTTKSMFESTVAMEFIATLDGSEDKQELEERYEKTRKAISEKASGIGNKDWLYLEEQLRAALDAAWAPRKRMLEEVLMEATA